jgi:hemerythrin-like domain-containing protein
MSGPVALWHTEHVYFRSLLDLLQKEVETFHRGERPNYELMLDIVAYLREFSDAFHHPREDMAFAILAKRCPDLKPVLARLEQEHRVIARAGEKLRSHLEASLGDAFIARAEVEVAAATYLVYYGNHISKEEELVMPRAAEALSADDWASVKASAPAQADPLFGEHPEERYKALRRQIALAAH